VLQSFEQFPQCAGSLDTSTHPPVNAPQQVVPGAAQAATSPGFTQAQAEYVSCVQTPLTQASLQLTPEPLLHVQTPVPGTLQGARSRGSLGHLQK